MTMPRVNGFAHVIDRQEADLDGGEGFHFNARAPGGLNLGRASQGLCGVLDEELDPDSCQGQGGGHKGIRSALRLAA